MRILAVATCLAACSPAAERTDAIAIEEPSAFLDALPAFEERLGGALGLVLIDGAGRQLLAHRPAERMAFCSSFKFALAAAAYEASDEGRLDLDADLAYDPENLPGYSPVLANGNGMTSLRDAIAAAVGQSDNGAANLLIDGLGGPDAVTARWRAWGDVTSRLDRREGALNENRPGDPRDTSTAAALAETIRLLDTTDILDNSDRNALFDHARQSVNGLDRVRAGLPRGWGAGDRSGTCRGGEDPDQQVNNIGFIDHPDGRDRYYYAVMVQRPATDLARTKAIMAEIGAHFAAAIGE